MLNFLLVAVSMALFSFPVHAQQVMSLCSQVPGLTTSSCVPVSTSNQLPVAVYDSSNHTGYCYTSNGSGSPATFQACSGGGGTPGGSSGQIQYNNAGAFGGAALSNTLAIASGVLGTTNLINAQSGTTYTVQSSDMGKTITQTNASASTYTLPQATTTGFGAGQSFTVINLGAGALTLTPTTSTINGLSSLVLAQYASAYVVSNGTNYVAFQGVPGSGSGGLTISSTGITGGTSTRVLFDNAGTLGEYAITGTGSVAMSASPTFTGTLTASAITATSNIAAGSSATISWTSRAVLTSPASATLQIGPSDSAAAINQTVQTYSIGAGNSNTAGSNLTIGAGKGTGTGAGGSLIFAVAPAGTTGTAQNALVTAVTIDSTKNTTFSALAVLKSYTVSGLPTGVANGMAVVTDAVACTFLATPTGGGATYCPVIYNGSAWVAH